MVTCFSFTTNATSKRCSAIILSLFSSLQTVWQILKICNVLAFFLYENQNDRFFCQYRLYIKNHVHFILHDKNIVMWWKQTKVGNPKTVAKPFRSQPQNLKLAGFADHGIEMDSPSLLIKKRTESNYYYIYWIYKDIEFVRLYTFVL